MIWKGLQEKMTTQEKCKTHELDRKASSGKAKAGIGEQSAAATTTLTNLQKVLGNIRRQLRLSLWEVITGPVAEQPNPKNKTEPAHSVQGQLKYLGV